LSSPTVLPATRTISTSSQTGADGRWAVSPPSRPDQRRPPPAHVDAIWLAEDATSLGKSLRTSLILPEKNRRSPLNHRLLRLSSCERHWSLRGPRLARAGASDGSFAIQIGGTTAGSSNAVNVAATDRRSVRALASLYRGAPQAGAPAEQNYPGGDVERRNAVAGNETPLEAKRNCGFLTEVEKSLSLISSATATSRVRVSCRATTSLGFLSPAFIPGAGPNRTMNSSRGAILAISEFGHARFVLPRGFSLQSSPSHAAGRRRRVR